MEEKQKKWMAAAGIAAFLLLSAAVGWFAGKPLVQFVSDPERFRAWVDSHGVWARLAFLGMVVLQVFVAIIPGEPLEIGAGYAFGVVEGTLLCVVGMTLGGLLVFGFVRRFGVRAV
ncbi:MAG: TVP38/TMEM64 family protein, partial [Faecousia sp.]